MASIMRWLCLWFLGLWMVGSPAHAGMPVSLRALLPPGVQVSLIVQSVHATDPIYAWQPDTLRLPASTLKVLTALGATLHLGHDYRFETRLLMRTGTLRGEVIHGDVALQLVGDPSLTRADLTALFTELRHQGVRRITGDLILDMSAFNGYDRARGWSWDDLGICFTAPAAAAIVDRNCVKGFLDTNPTEAVGLQLAQVHLLSPQPITVSSRVLAIGADQAHEYRFCDLDLNRLPNNHYHLTGCVSRRQHRLPLAFAVTEPSVYARAVIREEIQAVGIHLAGDLRFHQRPDPSTKIPIQARMLAKHQSLPLTAFLGAMLKESDNLVAETLLKTLGRVYFQQPGNYRNGAAALKAVLAQRAQVDLAGSHIADGSGLSRYNLLTARQILEVLMYIRQHDDRLRLLRHFPVAGGDGTLRKRRSLRRLKGQVMAKTGTMKHVSSLAGFLTTVSGGELAFVLLVNGYVPPEDSPPLATADPRPTLEPFETALFARLFHEQVP